MIYNFSKYPNDGRTGSLMNSMIENILNCADIGIFLLDSRGVITLINRHGLDMFGYPKDGLAGRDFSTLVHADSLDAFNDHFMKLLRSGKPLRGLETEVVRKDGSIISVCLSAAPNPDDGMIVGTALDITGQKRAVMELTEAKLTAENEKAKSRAIIDGLGVGVILQGPDFRVLYENALQRKQVGDHVGELCYKAYEGKDDICENCPMVLTLQDGCIHRHEKVLPSEEGDRHFELTSSPLFDSNGDIVGGIKLVREITEQRRLEEHLLHSQKMEAIGTLTGGIAHEFNNIITSILGFGEMLVDELGEDKRLGRYADMIVSAAERAAKLTDALRTFSRRQITHVELVDLNEAIRTTAQLLKNFFGEKIEFRIETGEKPIMVMADRSQLQQVIVNLANNAQDAMPEGGVFTLRSGAAGDMALLTVSDTGSGIYKHEKEKIFEPFFTTKEIGKGPGLGLSIVYGIIKKHGGNIMVDSELGRGTTFRISLPAVAEAHAEGDAQTVLLAEDDPSVRELIKMVLENAGFSIIEAADGEDAEIKFMEHKNEISLAILDVGLPKKTGIAVLNEIRPHAPSIKTLFISGYAPEDKRIREIAAAGYCLVPKPVSPKEVLKKVRELLG